MANYGETLAYWYLRLNGFVPMLNFVVHRDDGLKHPADVDVLAVRMPHVYEEVGGQDWDWHAMLREAVGFGRPIGLICEAKTGKIDEKRLFRQAIVERAVLRLGLIPTGDAQQVIEQLAETPLVSHNTATFVKLLVSAEPHAGPLYLNIALAEIEEFLKDRIRRYQNEKYASRHFFPSELFQHLIEQVRREAAELGI